MVTTDLPMLRCHGGLIGNVEIVVQMEKQALLKGQISSRKKQIINAKNEFNKAFSARSAENRGSNSFRFSEMWGILYARSA